MGKKKERLSYNFSDAEKYVLRSSSSMFRQLSKTVFIQPVNTQFGNIEYESGSVKAKTTIQNLSFEKKQKSWWKYYLKYVYLLKNVVTKLKTTWLLKQILNLQIDWVGVLHFHCSMVYY